MPNALARHRSRLVLTLLLAGLPVLGRAMPSATAATGAKGRPRAGVMSVQLKDGRKLSLFDPRSAGTAVANVGDEVVTVRDLAEALASAHGLHEPGPASTPDVASLLQRLIDVRLVASEAHVMGIDELPEFKAEIERFTEAALRDQLKRKAAARAKVDAAAVDRIYKKSVREWRVTSVLFEKEADAKELEERVRKGGSFDDLSARAMAEEKAKARQQGELLRDSELLPEVAAVVRKLEKGVLSGVTPVTGGFALLRLDGVHFPEDPQARAEAEAQVRNAAQFKAVTDYTQALIKRRAHIDRKLLVALDYDGKDAPLDALAKDRRVLVRIDGGKPLTVADLTRALEKKFFHGAKQAAESKRVNKDKELVLRAELASRLLVGEARRQRLQDTEEMKYLVREKRHTLAFAALLERVILPDVKVTDADVEAYYDRHGAEFTYPAMYRLEGLAFSSAAGAETAARKLRSGTDFGWLRANAEGQIDPTEQVLQFGNLPVAASTLPPELAAALAGVKAGDCRTYGQGGVHYVIRAIDATAPGRQPLGEVRDAIHKKVFGEKVQAAIVEWTRKLREHYPVEVLLASAG